MSLPLWAEGESGRSFNRARYAQTAWQHHCFLDQPLCPIDTGEYYPPAHGGDDHKWGGRPSERRHYGNVTVREALNRSLNTVAWQILTDIGVNFGLDYLGQMEFQKLTWVDNNVPSSIGGFTNGVRCQLTGKGLAALWPTGPYTMNGPALFELSISSREK